MSAAGQTPAADPGARLQALLGALDAVRDPEAQAAARGLVQAVMELHGAGLSDLLAIVDEAGNQPADILLTRFAANPKVCSLLLLHDLHPQDLATRARLAVERLRPHLGVRGVRADFVDAENGVVRVRVTASGQKTPRPSATELQQEIGQAVLNMTPDAADLIIEGLETTGAAREVYVPLSSIAGRHGIHEQVGATSD